MREIDVSGGFTPETDWAAANDLNGALASGSSALGESANSLSLAFHLLNVTGGQIIIDDNDELVVDVLAETNQPDAQNRLFVELTVTMTGGSVDPQNLPYTRGRRFFRLVSLTTLESPTTLQLLAIL